jgi:hypothetical protein
MFQGEMDPEIAALLGTSVAADRGAARPPDYSSLFDDPLADGDAIENPEVDITEEHFPEITKRLEPAPRQIFNDSGYYKKALAGEGDKAQRVHTIIQKYVNATDPKDRGVFRQQLVSAYWDFLLGVAQKAAGRLSESHKYLLRFGILHPNFMNPGDKDFFARTVEDNYLNQPVYYLDEWFKAVGTGVIRNSSTDEVRIARNNTQIRMQQLMEKAMGKRDGARNLLKAKSEERGILEHALVEKVQFITEHYPIEGFSDINSCYTESQKRAFQDIQELIKNLIKADRELDAFMRDFNQAEADVHTLKNKVEEEGGAIEVDVRAIVTEFETVRQMAKMTIGRQGNHFPLMTKEYFRCNPNTVGTRENILAQLIWLESIDPEAFSRSYKNRMNRIVPYVVLIPSYGDIGICWEPFDRFNRATSRGRIALPMYPKNLSIAVLSAVADLRWQVAKEKASYYWMEEGLTGNYYQWFTSRKLKGDVKEYFIEDYITWITKESEAIQKLDKEVRGIFWRYVPFAQIIKDRLKGRSYIYQELYQRDVNRSLSDGY